MAGPGDRFGIAVETGPVRLNKDRTFFRFGKRVESLILANRTAGTVVADVQVARDPVFYFPADHAGGSGNVQSYEQQTYFYASLKAGETWNSPPFFADRGLKVKRIGYGVMAQAIVHGVNRGDAKFRDIG